MSEWDFGGAYAGTAKTLQDTELARLSFGDEQAHRQSLTRLNNANASSVEHRVASEQRISQIMNGMSLTEGEQGSAAIMKLAGVAMQAGDATTARDLILRAAQAQQYESQALRYATLASKDKFQMEAKKGEEFAELMRGVKVSENPREAFELAKQVMLDRYGEEIDAEYDPRLVDLLENSATSLRDRAYAQHLAEKRKIDGARLTETRRYHDETLKIRQAAEERRRLTAGANTKAGGKDVGAPTTSETKTAKTLLQQQGKLKGLDTDTQARASSELAARARALRKANPGLDHSEASQRALVEMTTEGYFATERATGLRGLVGGTKKVYGKPGATADRPLPVPKDKSFKTGTYYSTPKGTLLYLGDNKWQVPDAPEPDDEDEEE